MSQVAKKLDEAVERLKSERRGNTTFTGDLKGSDPAGNRSKLDAGTQSFVQVTLGVGVRLGS